MYALFPLGNPSLLLFVTPFDSHSTICSLYLFLFPLSPHLSPPPSDICDTHTHTMWIDIYIIDSYFSDMRSASRKMSILEKISFVMEPSIVQLQKENMVSECSSRTRFVCLGLGLGLSVCNTLAPLPNKVGTTLHNHMQVFSLHKCMGLYDMYCMIK